MKCTLAKIAMWLSFVGALNWGLVGVGDFMGKNWNVVELLLGRVSWLESLVYVVVGVSAIVMVWGCKCTVCSSGSCEPTA